MRARAFVGGLVVALAPIALAACADDADDGAAQTPSATTEPSSTAAPVATIADGELTAPAAGSLRLVFGGGVTADLRISACVIDLGARPDGEVPAELVRVAASGSDADGRDVNLELRRFRSAGASDTITDTVTVALGDPAQPEQALVAQRFEVDGVVTDPRDPEADDPLVRVGQGQVDATGTFAPPGAFADDGGLVEGALVAVCEP